MKVRSNEDKQCALHCPKSSAIGAEKIKLNELQYFLFGLTSLLPGRPPHPGSIGVSLLARSTYSRLAQSRHLEGREWTEDRNEGLDRWINGSMDERTNE